MKLVPRRRATMAPGEHNITKSCTRTGLIVEIHLISATPSCRRDIIQ